MIKVRARVISLALGHLRYRHKAPACSLLIHSSDLYKEARTDGDGHDIWSCCR